MHPTHAPDVTVALASPGGNLFEGIRLLGQAIRAASIPTLVMSDKTCASACAIAFLGGKTQGAASAAVRRELEPGARLAFHGYKLTADEVHVANETLDTARVVNAIILDYASRMGDVDIGTLAELLNVPPEKVEIIDTPRKIAALGITLAGQPLKPPKGWAVNACRAAIAKQLSVLDAFRAENRLRGEAEPMANLEAFRRRLLDDKYPAEGKTAAVRGAVMKLPAGDAVDLLAGGAVYLEQGKVGVWRVRGLQLRPASRSLDERPRSRSEQNHGRWPNHCKKHGDSHSRRSRAGPLDPQSGCQAARPRPQGLSSPRPRPSSLVQ
jgi:hypothetical protein